MTKSDLRLRVADRLGVWAGDVRVGGHCRRAVRISVPASHVGEAAEVTSLAAGLLGPKVAVEVHAFDKWDDHRSFVSSLLAGAAATEPKMAGV